MTNERQGGECFVRLNSERTLKAGIILVAGEKRILIEVGADGRGIAVLDAKGTPKMRIEASTEERTLGRSDIDPKDPLLSRSHFSITDVGDRLRVSDMSRNGTFVELHGRLRLNEGDDVWMGNQKFRFLGLREAVPGVAATRPPAPAKVELAAAQEAAPVVSVKPKTKSAATPPPVPVVVPPGKPVVLLADGSSLSVTPDQPILSFLVEDGRASSTPNDIKGKCQTLWECWEGPENPLAAPMSCGKCVITIEQGMELLTEGPPDKRSREKYRINKRNTALKGRLDEAKCRLACWARVERGGQVRIKQNGRTDG